MKRPILTYLISNDQLVVTRLIQVSIALFLFGLHGLANTLVIFVGAFVLLKTSFFSLKKLLFNKYFLAFITVFILTITSVLWSEDFSEAFKYVELRLLLVLFPIIFGLSVLDKKFVDTILITFMILVFLSLLCGLLLSTLQYQGSGDSGYFFNDNLIDRFDKQAPYFAIYVNFSLILLVYFFKISMRGFRMLLTFAGLFFLVCLLLLAVRISILTFFILSILCTAYLFFKYKSKLLIALSLITLGAVITLTMSLPQTSARFKSMFSNLEYSFDNPNPVNHFNGQISSQNWNGLNLRLALWHCGTDIIKQHPFIGVGVGDYKKFLKAEFQNKKFTYALDQNFGIHNQYLYAAVSWGIIGLLCFLLSLYLPIRKALMDKNILFLALMLLVLIGFMTENLLNRYIGVYFIGLFSSLLFFSKNPKSN